MRIKGYIESGATFFELTLDVESRLVKLTGDVGDYFDNGEATTVMVAATAMYMSRYRAEGILSANGRMLEVSRGRYGKRAPIQVKAHPIEPDSFVVCDGNSTFCNLFFSGFDWIPVHVV